MEKSLLLLCLCWKLGVTDDDIQLYERHNGYTCEKFLLYEKINKDIFHPKGDVHRLSSELKQKTEFLTSFNDITVAQAKQIVDLNSSVIHRNDVPDTTVKPVPYIGVWWSDSSRGILCSCVSGGNSSLASLHLAWQTTFRHQHGMRHCPIQFPCLLTTVPSASVFPIYLPQSCSWATGLLSWMNLAAPSLHLWRSHLTIHWGRYCRQAGYPVHLHPVQGAPAAQLLSPSTLIRWLHCQSC